MRPVDDPEFYCHGQKCIDQGCSPLRCRDCPDEWLEEWPGFEPVAFYGGQGDHGSE